MRISKLMFSLILVLLFIAGCSTGGENRDNANDNMMNRDPMLGSGGY